MDILNNGIEAAAEPLNANCLTAEQQEEYKLYYAINPEYHPAQPIPGDQRHFGSPIEVNNFLQDFDDMRHGCTTLGEMNLKADYNTKFSVCAVFSPRGFGPSQN